MFKTKNIQTSNLDIKRGERRERGERERGERERERERERQRDFNTVLTNLGVFYFLNELKEMKLTVE